MSVPTTLERLAWRVIWPSWAEDERARALATIARTPPGAVTAFRRHVPSLDEAVALTRAVLHASVGTTRLAIDEEGGPVRRMPAPFPTFPAAARWAAAAIAPDAFAGEVRALGAALSRVGFAIDFAPVADLEFDADHPALRQRCFGRVPEAVAPFVAAYVSGLRAAGVAPCLKHAPGHGAVAADSHVAMDTLAVDLDTARRRELVPFRAGIAAGAPLIMAAHFMWPALDPRQPTTWSAALVRLLRVELQFAGVLLTDDLEMGAVKHLHTPGERAVLALAAGYDVALFCHTLSVAEEAAATLTRELERSAALRAHVATAAARVDRLPQVPVPADTATVVAALQTPPRWSALA